MKAHATLGLAAVVGFAAAASADVLWDQGNYDPDGVGLINQEFGDYPSYASYMVTDVVSTDWTIQSVSTFFTDQNGGLWTGVTQARLNIFDWVPGTLPVAGDDPTAGAVVDVTVTDLGSELQMTASGLNVDLPAGNYWVGLTPIADLASFGQEFHLPAPIIGDNTAFRNPGGGFGYGPDWMYAYALGYWQDQYDASILIEGVPAPGALALLGLAGLVSRRRR
jgi:uncharacterized protein (TIGR03382 family)